MTPPNPAPKGDPPDWPLVERQAVRAVILDPQNRVLLLRCAAGDGGPPFWITPGGGIDPGESEDETLIRELREELGWSLDPTNLGPCIWTRTHTFPWPPKGVRLKQHERYRLCRPTDAQPVLEHHRTPDEVQVLSGHRWWSADDIERASSEGERFAPRAFGQQLRVLISRGPPARPIDVGV
ncbi:MAG: NUDIX domain-containing protein [Planctomycetota bacterium]